VKGRAEARVSAVRQQFHFLAGHHESGHNACIEYRHPFLLLEVSGLPWLLRPALENSGNPHFVITWLGPMIR
jgi:hypothetical protein